MRTLIPILALAGLVAAAACRESPVDPVEPDPVGVEVVPSALELVAGESATFTATVSGAAERGVSWLVSGGTFIETEPGAIRWTSPLESGTYVVMAISAADPSASATAGVIVLDPEGLFFTDFVDYRGTPESLPPRLFVTGENAAAAFTGVHDITAEPAPSFEGFGAFTNGAGHYAFGIRERGETDLREARVFLTYRNDAPRHVVGFHVRYDVEAWYLGQRANRIRLKFSTDTVGFGDLPDLVSTPNPRGAAMGAEIGRIVDGSRAENRVAVSRTVDLASVPGPGDSTIASLAPGETGYFRWQYSNAEDDDGPVRSGLALANLRVVPIYSDDPPGPVPTAPLRWSHEAGFHTAPFQLGLETWWADGTLLYTVDGSAPDPARVLDDEAWAALPIGERARSFVYDGAIDLAPLLDRPAEIARIPTTGDGVLQQDAWREPAVDVERAVVIRAAVIREGERAVEGTRTFFFWPTGRERYTLPVVSLAADRPGLFGDEAGIYVPGATGRNYDRRGDEWERAAHMELFDLAGARPLAQPVGLRIHGGWTRRVAKKSFRVYSRSDYGVGRMAYRFFDSKPLDDFNRIILRNGGNDWADAIIRDATVHALVRHLGFATQHSAPAVVFLNGEYWGLHVIRERIDRHFLETNYGVPRDRVAILTRNAVVSEGDPSDAADYRAFLDDIAAGRLAGRADFDARMDVAGYLDYLVAQIYAGNFDWPHNNIDWWRYTGPPEPGAGARDGRWRWILYDLDPAFAGIGSNEDFDMVAHLLDPDRVPWARELVLGMMAVPELRHELIQRIAVHLETTFDPDRVRVEIATAAARIEPEVEENFARWNSPRGHSHWAAEVDRMRAFAAVRPEAVRGHVIDRFDEVGGVATLEVAGLDATGDVALYSVRLGAGEPGVGLEGGTWRGRLFIGVPIDLASGGPDLSAAAVSGEARVLDRSAERLRLVLDGPARIELP